jgi:hypothetical protein
MRPRSITTMRSAFSTVARRCAMTMVVRSCMSRSSACCTSRSLSASSALVASSSSRIGGLLEDRAGDRDALALAARQARAALAQEGVVALGQLADELVRGRGLRGRLDLRIGGAGPAVADVLARGRAEQHVSCGTRPMRRRTSSGGRAMSTPSTRIAAGIRVVEAQQQLEGRALAGAGRADEGDRLARPIIEREARQRGCIRPRRVAEADTCSKLDAAAAGCGSAPAAGGMRRSRARLLSSASRSIAPAARCTSLHTRSARRPRPRRTLRTAGTGRARHRSSAGQHRMGTEPQHEGDRAEPARHRSRSAARGPHRGAGPPGTSLDRLVVALRLQLLQREGLHGLDRVQRLAGQAAGVGDAVLRVRDSRRTRRPITISGTTTTGTSTMISPSAASW